MSKADNYDKLREFWTKLKSVKHIKIIIGIALVALLLLIYYTVNGNASDKKTEESFIANKNCDSTVTYSDNERKLSEILSQIKGAGETKVFINYAKDDTVVGVLIVAEGADDNYTKLQLIQAAQTVLKINSDRIKVYSTN